MTTRASKSPLSSCIKRMVFCTVKSFISTKEEKMAPIQNVPSVKEHCTISPSWTYWFYLKWNGMANSGLVAAFLTPITENSIPAPFGSMSINPINCMFAAISAPFLGHKTGSEPISCRKISKYFFVEKLFCWTFVTEKWYQTSTKWNYFSNYSLLH